MLRPSINSAKGKNTVIKNFTVQSVFIKQLGNINLNRYQKKNLVQVKLIVVWMLQQMYEYCLNSFYLSNAFQSSYRNEHCFARKQSRNGYSFHNVDVITPFLCSSQCKQGIQGVSVCPEGKRLVRNGRQTKLLQLRIGD